MVPLPLSIQRNGSHLNQVCRCSTHAIYRELSARRTHVGFEVIHIISNPEFESYPDMMHWNTARFKTMFLLADALAAYNQMIKCLADSTSHASPI
jgi:hypothetical protein